MRRIQTIITFLLLWSSSYAQYFESAHAVWDDSFREWEIQMTEDNSAGFEIRWQLRNDYTTWNVDLAGLPGVIQLKWNDDPNVWEYRSGNQIIIARTKWSNDYSQWKLSDGQVKLELETRYRDDTNEWWVKSEKDGHFILYSEYLNDPRDWIIEDDMEAYVSAEMRLMMIFLACFHSSPKQ